MSEPQKRQPPAGYLEVEKALHLLDMGETSRWVAAKLQPVANPAAQEAAALLRAKERGAACAVLEAELLRLAGDPERVEGLAWFTPATEQVRDERRRPW
jgi:hypothetical protein